jgi:hypothetical protein
MCDAKERQLQQMVNELHGLELEQAAKVQTAAASERKEQQLTSQLTETNHQMAELEKASKDTKAKLTAAAADLATKLDDLKAKLDQKNVELQRVEKSESAALDDKCKFMHKCVALKKVCYQLSY